MVEGNMRSLDLAEAFKTLRINTKNAYWLKQKLETRNPFF